MSKYVAVIIWIIMWLITCVGIISGYKFDNNIILVWVLTIGIELRFGQIRAESK